MTLLTLFPTGYFLDLDSDGPHTFCGPQSVAGAWCPNCDLPLYRYLELSGADQLLVLPPAIPPTLPLLFCWRCNLAQQPFYYRVLHTSVELLSYGQGKDGDDFPYREYPAYFPASRARLRALTAFEAKAIVEINEGADDFQEPYRSLSRPTHQVGGIPILIQGDYHQHFPEAATCPLCSSPMPFLATFGDRCLDPRGFAGYEYVQVHFSICPDHSVVSAHQACD